MIDELTRQVTTYSTLDIEEFAVFMTLHAEKELEAYRQIFVSMDEDGSGDISRAELITFMRSLGFTPLQHMINEACYSESRKSLAITALSLSLCLYIYIYADESDKGTHFDK